MHCPDTCPVFKYARNAMNVNDSTTTYISSGSSLTIIHKIRGEERGDYIFKIIKNSNKEDTCTLIAESHTSENPVDTYVKRIIGSIRNEFDINNNKDVLKRRKTFGLKPGE